MIAFLTSKLGIYAIMGVLVIMLIGGVVLEMRYLENRIEVVQKMNAQLEISNNALTENIKALNLQQAQIIKENNNARVADNRALQEIQKTIITVTQKDAQINRVRKSNPKALFTLLNKNLECERLHFLETGKCVNGLWRAAS